MVGGGGGSLANYGGCSGFFKYVLLPDSIFGKITVQVSLSLCNLFLTFPKVTIGSGGYKSSEGRWTLTGSDTEALVFCEDGELCKTLQARAGRARDDDGQACGWNAGGQV